MSATFWANFTTTLPAWVSEMPDDERLMSDVPNFFSMLAIFWESPGRDM